MTASVKAFPKKDALTVLAEKDLCETWPINKMKFESLTGRWESAISEFKSLPGTDATMLTLAFNLLAPDPTSGVPTHRMLNLILYDFYFVNDELYGTNLNQAILDFLDSGALQGEVQAAGTFPPGL